jgi:nucleotide-binding universal stress UspA family protein
MGDASDRTQEAAAAGAARRCSLPRIARVLAPTDFSELANHAVGYAYALLPGGGTVYLLHAVEEVRLPNPLYAHYTPGRHPSAAERAAQRRDLEQALHALVPEEAAGRGIETRVEVVEGEDPARAILAAAERLDVDVTCMGTHGRSGVSALVAGCVACEVASGSSRPLFLVRPPKRG